jgi:hypothetical protein
MRYLQLRKKNKPVSDRVAVRYWSEINVREVEREEGRELVR